MDGEERNRDPSARRGRERRDNFIEDSLDPPPPPPPRTRCNYSSITQSRPPRVPYNQITGRDSDIKLSSIDSDPKKRCVSLLRAATLDWTKPTRERKEGREGEREGGGSLNLALEFDGTSRIKRPLCNPRGDRANVSKQGWRRLKEREKKKKVKEGWWYRLLSGGGERVVKNWGGRWSVTGQRWFGFRNEGGGRKGGFESRWETMFRAISRYRLVDTYIFFINFVSRNMTGIEN